MMRNPTLGKMRQKLKLQTPTRSDDGGGSGAITWTTAATIFGHIQPRSGNERFFGEQLEERVSHVITIRHRRDVTNKNKLVYEHYVKGVKYTRTFNVQRTMNRDSRNRFLDILCEEGVAT